jgi:hypothetical protein
LPAFKDKRYIRVDGKPLFFIFAPYHIPDARLFIHKWNELAKENGLQGIHFVANPEGTMCLFRRIAFRLSSNKKRFNTFFRIGFDAVIIPRRAFRGWRTLWYGLAELIGINVVLKYDYGKATKDLLVGGECAQENIYPVVLPNWDRTPRLGKRADIWHGSTPELFRQHVCKALKLVENKETEHKIIFLKSWNEWGEGNYIEPDSVFGKQYLETLKQAIFE